MPRVQLTSATKRRIFQFVVTVLAASIALSAVRGWAHLDESIAQTARLFGAVAEGPRAGEPATATDLYQGGADLVSLSVAMLAAALLAGMLAWKTPARADARALALFLVFIFLPDDILRTPLEVFGISLDDRTVASLGWIPVWLALAAFLRFSALFPERSIVRETHPTSVRHPAPHRGRRAMLRARSGLLRPGVVWPTAAILSLITIGLTVIGGAIVAQWIMIFWLAVLAAIVSGVLQLLQTYRSSTPVERAQILWVVFGFYAAAWAAVLIYILVPFYERYAPPSALGGLGWLAIGQLLLPLPLILIVVSLYVGVFHGGALDPERAIRKTTTYGLVVFVEILLFTAVEEVTASALVERVVGPTSSRASAYIGGGAIALAFRPLKHWIEARAERWMPRGLRSPGRESA